jgi:two-component system sensor histidine kinase KdpD
VRVADDGPGLPPGDEERVFEKFVRGRPGPADGRRGVGLGLAIVRAVVEAHGGHIVARNRSTGGAEFLITLPLPADVPRVRLDEVPVESGA